MNLKPMLAAPADLDNLRFPLLASPKLDGIRALKVKEGLLSRTLKRIPNRHIQSAAWAWPAGLDGELIVGSPTDKDVYRNTVSGVMKVEGIPNFTFWVFDQHDRRSVYQDALEAIQQTAGQHISVEVLSQEVIGDLDSLLAYEAQQVELGFEGVILRDPHAPYKFGRSTAKEGYLLKVKRFEDSEAQVIGVVEEQHNGNEATKDNLGRTKRSTAKAGKTGKGTMGTLVCRDLKSGVEFEIGTGFTAADRTEYFSNPPKIVKYKFFPVGVKDKPRHPVFLGVRDERDL